MYAKDPYGAKYKFLNNKQDSTGLKHFNYYKTFIEYSNDMDGIYQNTKQKNPNKKRKILIAFDVWLLICLIIKNLIRNRMK